MPKLDEHGAVEQVFERLTARFSDVPVETVRHTVHAIHDGLEGPVRDYVPLLVEHAARDALAAGAAPGDRPATSL
jgi:hypothetical protein